MPNALTALGLTTNTRAELVAKFTAAFQTIYGSDINLDSDSPDGQLLNIIVQVVLDDEDLLTQIYNSFDPDTAIGIVLDSRVAINGIQRESGTHSITNVTITVTEALTLPGLDQDILPAYTVADSAGTQWQLITSESPGAAGAYIYAFQALNPGATLTTLNTITVPVTIILGVSAINNPTALTTLGLNEETDAALKLRRQISVALASQGYLAGLLAALENTSAVTSAFVHENTSDTPDGDGVPGHSIWVIVAGTPADVDIAQDIYTKRNAGCGFKTDVTNSYVITQKDGSPFTVYWDTVVLQNVFIKFTATSLDGVHPPNIAAIIAGLPGLFVPGVNEEININRLATFVQDIDPNTLVTNAGFSLTAGGVYTNTLSPSTKNRQFLVSSAKVIVLAIILSPSVVSVAAGGSTQQFTPLGGYGPYTYAMVSGLGSVGAGTGLYTSAGAGTDVVRVTDSLGNTGDATVTVT